MPSKKITIRPVTQLSELAGLGQMQDECLKDDGLEKYGLLASQGVPARVYFQNAIERNFKEGPDHIMLLRAIEEVDQGDAQDKEEEEKVVGFTCWYFGTGAARHGDGAKDKEQTEGAVDRKGAEETSVPVVPPPIPAVDPKEREQVEKAALEERAAKDGVDEVQKAKEKRKIERATEMMNNVIRPWGEWYDKSMAGKQHIYLRQLYVLPSHQGRGIASHFMRWGCEKADQNGWPGFLLSTERGRPVYLKYGWYEEHVFRVPKPDLENEDESSEPLGYYQSYVMLRSPRKV
ncbi:MAG: hypothetical protein Q9160_009047 [Pyrenula sp. 1 TL-2023]